MDWKFLLIPAVTIGIIMACSEPPDYPIEPVIELIGLSKTEWKQGDLNDDSLTIVLSFTDGDGDLGSNDSINVVAVDTRDGFEAGKFRIPFIEAPGVENGISGEIFLLLFSTCCIYPEGGPPTCTPSADTQSVSYDVYITDRAGNRSNTVNTGPIRLLCQ